MYAAVELFRFPLTNVLPDFAFLFVSLLSGLLMLLVGVIYFRRTEDFFADLA
jgi:lipopolysaccharide transport system permease protein